MIDTFFGWEQLIKQATTHTTAIIMDDFSSDDYFATLGGNLMKDLLADLQGDDEDDQGWSLEQLEKELSTLDSGLAAGGAPPPVAPLTAASLVVSHATQQQQQQQQTTAPPPGVTAPPPGMDAWSLSLEKFTSLSLERDFLAADSERKQQTSTVTAPPGLPAVSLDGAEDYDVAEKVSMAPPPPGITASAVESLLNSSNKTAAAQSVPNPKQFPQTPQNSLVNDAGGPPGAIPPQQQQQQQNIMQQQQKSAQPSVGSLPPQRGAPPPQQQQQQMPPPAGVIPPQQQRPPMMQMPPNVIPQQMPPPVMGQVVGPPPQMMGQPVPMGMPVPTGGPAWQTPARGPPPQMMPPPPPIRAFCNPHPAASPVPCSALETKYMNSRDIAYVIHSILRPVFAAGVSEDDYYIQVLRRISGQKTNPANNPTKPRDMDKEMTSREQKTKEWANEKTTLGHVAKTNVTRPRALIATTVTASEQDSTDQKQRASLWKARIYCDQAYQAYQSVVDIWRSAPPGAVPPEVQAHLKKLMKCMGITVHDNSVYKADPEGLKMLVKLAKGRTLFSRVLEQALLPPNAVQAILPVALSVMTSPQTKKDDAVDERVFRAITNVLRRLNQLSGSALTESVNAVAANGKSALSSTARMECVHTMLQMGSAVASQDPSEEVRNKWKQAEASFMELLQGL